MHLESQRQVEAARLTPASEELTILYADGGRTSSAHIDLEAANKTVTELGLLPGGTSNDGVRHWWR